MYLNIKLACSQMNYQFAMKVIEKTTRCLSTNKALSFIIQFVSHGGFEVLTQFCMM